MCAPGYVSAPDAPTVCGQQCSGSASTYGDNDRDLSAPNCKACPTPGGYPFWFNAEPQLFAPAAVARLGATSAGECLSEFAQFNYMAWHVGGNATMEAVPDAATFEACVAACTGGCQYVTFDYVKNVCERKMTIPTTDRLVVSSAPGGGRGAGWVGSEQLLQTNLCTVLTHLSCPRHHVSSTTC